MLRGVRCPVSGVRSQAAGCSKDAGDFQALPPTPCPTNHVPRHLSPDTTSQTYVPILRGRTTDNPTATARIPTIASSDQPIGMCR